MKYADETRLFFNDDFTSTIDNILENTFFNLIQEATHEELDLCSVRKKYVNISQDKWEQKNWWKWDFMKF